MIIFCPSQYEHDFISHNIHDKSDRVIYSGIGKVKTLTALMQEIHDNAYGPFILAGFAGGYKGLNPGDIVYPENIMEHDFYASNMDGPEPKVVSTGFNSDKAIPCDFYSGDSFITGEKLDGFFSQKIACDMESYAFTYALQRMEEKFFIIKVISDLCNADSHEDFMSAFKKYGYQILKSIEIAKEELNKCK